VDAVVGVDESAEEGVGCVWFTAVGREPASGAASVASVEAAVVTEIYLCDVCSCQERY
jgi:hypothetical protein